MSEPRKLTPFIANEMLFDFATGQLDAERKAAIEAFIKDDIETQNLLESIRRGMAYAESLKSLQLTDTVMSELAQAENIVSLSKRLARWSEWPDSLRWSIVALLVSISTSAMVVLIPWKSIPLFRTGPTFDSSTIEIARVETKTKKGDDGLVASVETETKDEESGPLEGSGDEEFSAEASGAIAPAPPVLPPPTPVVVVAAPPPKSVATNAPVSSQTPAPPSAPAAATKASRSFVYRAFMTLSDLEDIAPKITQQVKELGAEKAGEVELGWRRGSGRYYHFTIPEMNEQKLLENLRVYGPVRISKDPHPRVMPEGQVRFILWIESGS